MEMIRKIMTDASFPIAQSLKAFWMNYAQEVKILSTFIVLGMGAISYNPSFVLIEDLATIESLSSDSTSEVVLAKSEQIDLQKVVSKTMSYSYADTQLGFYLKNLRFFNSNSKIDAEDKILANLPKRLSKKAKNFVRAVLKVSEKHQVDPIWILSVMWTESHFDYSAQSWAGARGLMQIMPDTRTFIYKVYKQGNNNLLVEMPGFNVNEYFPYRIAVKDKKSHIKKLVNIELGVIYLKTLLNSFKSHKYATVAYNMGPGWTRGRLRRKLPVGQKNEYLDKVRKAYKQIVRKI
jgi:hypothetical protein